MLLVSNLVCIRAVNVISDELVCDDGKVLLINVEQVHFNVTNQNVEITIYRVIIEVSVAFSFYAYSETAVPKRIEV